MAVSSPAGYSVRERGKGAALRFVVAFAHLADPATPRKWPERTAPRELRTRTAVSKWAEGVIAAVSVIESLKAPPKPQGPTVRALYEPWLAAVEKRPGLERATIAGYRSAFRAVILPTLGDEPAAGLDVARCRTWVRELRERGAQQGLRGGKAKAAKDGHTLSPSRINNCASTLATFLSDMAADGKVPFSTNPMLDPAVRRELPERPRARRVRLDEERPGCATMEDVQAVIDDPATPIAEATRDVLAFTTALRDGELAGLRVRAVRRDAAVPHLVVAEAVKLIGPKGHATPGNLKTASSERVVPLHPAALAAISEWLDVHWIRVVGRAPRPDDFVFPRADGRPSRPKSPELFRRALKRAGRPTVRGGQPVTFHRARHTFASALAAAGVPHELRTLLLGHAAASVTELSYTEHGLAKLAEAVAAVPLQWRTHAEDRRPGPAKTGRIEGQSSESGRAMGSAEAGKPIPCFGSPDHRVGGILAAAPRRGDEAGGFQGRDVGGADVNATPGARQTVRQNARQAAERPSGKLNENREPPSRLELETCGLRNGRAFGERGPVEPSQEAKKAAEGYKTSGRTTRNGPARRSAKAACRTTEGLCRAAAAGLMVGLSDAQWATLGVNEDEVMLGASGASGGGA